MNRVPFRVIAAVAACLASFAAPAAAAPPALSVGLELAAPAPGSGAGIVFVDAMKQAAPWTAAQTLALDSYGNVTSLRPGQIADSVVYSGERYPAGDYTLLYDGRAAFGVTGGTIVAQAPGRALVRVVPNAGLGLHLRLLATNPNDYARNVRLILPGFANSYRTSPFYPAFVQSLQGQDVIRFDAWMQADSYAASAVWPLRPHVDRFTQALPGGVAPEYAIALANATGKTPWFALPVGATNQYVYRFADLVHRTLDPRLNAIFQYGGAVWQAGTPGNAWAIAAGHNVGLASDPQTAALDWYGTRSVQVFALVARAFGNDAARVTRVVAGPPADAAGIAIDRAIAARVAGNADAFAFAAGGNAATAAASVAFAGTQRAAAIATGGTDASSYAAWRAAGGAMWLGSPAAQVVNPTPVAWMPHGSVGVSAYHAPLEVVSHRRRRHAPVVPAYVNPRELAPPSGPELDAMVGEPMRNPDLAGEGNEDWLRWNGTAPTARAARGDRAIRVADGGLALDVPAGTATRTVRLYVDGYRSRPVLRATLSDASARPAEVAYESRFGRSEAVYTVEYRAKSAAAALHLTLSPGPSGSVALRAVTLNSEAIPSVSPTPSDMTTYHNDLARSGWDPNEYALNERSVYLRFGLQQTIAVKGDVLAQPLYLANYNLGAKGVHNLLIVATEADVIYEFDADTGVQLNGRTYGRVEWSSHVGCTDIEPEYGITSTPVIDRPSGTIYFVAVSEPTPYAFQTSLHAVDIGTLRDKVPPVPIVAQATMSNGSTISFNPATQQSRTGLVLSNGSIYVGIGSHCDMNTGSTTGWMLQYKTGSLQQTAALPLGEDTSSGLLDSIWMSGFASAVDGAGNLYAVTGNGSFDASSPGGKNYSESVVKLAPDVSSVLSYFTPTEYATLDQNDQDFGSGGVMLLPPQPGNLPNLAVAMGKSSKLYLLDTDALGGLGMPVQEYDSPGGGVWGGPTFYNSPNGPLVFYQTDSDVLRAYVLRIAATGAPYLTPAFQGLSNAGYGGSLPIVSSWGQKVGTGVVWLVQRNSTLRLEAYRAKGPNQLLFAGNAGVWNNPANNGFVTPLVANGRVYVPGSGTISVFGLH